VLLLRIRKFWSILLHKRCWRGLWHGVAASMEHRQVLQHLASVHCRTVVDIGANRGQFALAVHTFLPDATVLAFEPLGGPASKFRRVFESVKQVRLQQFAIGASACVADIHVSHSDDSSSLLPIGDLQQKHFPGTAEAGVEKVNMKCLSDVVRGTDILGTALLKIDVQGYEMEVLRGSVNLLPHFAYAYVECSFVELYQGQPLADEVIAFLREHGLRLGGAHNLSYDSDGSALQGDFLFVRAQHR